MSTPSRTGAAGIERSGSSVGVYELGAVSTLVVEAPLTGCSAASMVALNSS
jgi:hypothetical protein